MKKTGIVAFSFGVPYTILSNQRIAQIASEKARTLNACVYTQLDIHVGEDIAVTYTEEEPSKPPPTLRIARGVVRWAQKHKLIELWVVAAKPHLWRAFRDTKEAVRESGEKIKVSICKEIEGYSESSWYCLDSTQKRTRSQKAWNRQDRILRVTPFWIYKFIAN